MLIIGVIWRSLDLARAPHDRGLQLLVTSLFLLASGEVLSVPEINGAVDALTTVGVGKLAFNACTMIGLSALVLFFAFSTHRANAYRRYLRFHAGLLAGVLVALTIAMTATPPALRGHTLSTPYMARPEIAAFYVIGNVYFLYAYLTSGLWALRYARRATRHLALGLRTMSFGLFVVALSSVNRVVWVYLRIEAPRGHQSFNTVNWSMTDLALGTVTAGMSYSAGMQLFAHLRSVALHRRMYHQLTPLWTALAAAYPELVLNRESFTTRRNRLRLRGTHERFYRRLIECRDGLVRLSPYLIRVAPDADLARGPADRIAHHITAALAVKPAVEDPDAALSAAPIAFPSGNDLAADARELIAISHAYAKGTSEQAPDHR
ncbi:MAB_1171c family putative transporter [Streptomyces noursei]|uniref:MAB_1171c family putative transporter n=1 Tax=Streptomyces noursei TaxID=1971 RepID=UPI0030F06AF5